MTGLVVRSLEDRDRLWVADVLRGEWHDTLIVSRGRLYQADTLPGFVAERDGVRVGQISYVIDGDACEIVTLKALVEGIGAGSALIEAVKAAVSGRCKRLWLTTTNDNTPALRFYQKRGFHLVAVYPNAMAESRKLKPSISLIGLDGIPLRDEIELEMWL